jgi:nucleoside 2-deoxyribosyltransferase
MLGMQYRIYLAGPDVFFPDVAERAAALKSLCAKFGYEGVFPLDSGVQLLRPLNQEENGFLIYEANIKLIRGCHGVLANMSPFRGPSMDPGTAFEMGFGRALGLEVVGYTDTLTQYKSRVEPDGMLVEDFSMIDNLMVHAAACGDIFNGPEEALDYLAKVLDSGEPTR